MGPINIKEGEIMMVINTGAFVRENNVFPMGVSSDKY